MSDDTLTGARDLVAAVLRGERTPENDPALFEDDILYFQVTTLSRQDPTWLEAVLRDSTYTATARFAVLGQSSLPDATRLTILEALVDDMPGPARAETQGFLEFLRSRL